MDDSCDAYQYFSVHWQDRTTCHSCNAYLSLSVSCNAIGLTGLPHPQCYWSSSPAKHTILLVYQYSHTHPHMQCYWSNSLRSFLHIYLIVYELAGYSLTERFLLQRSHIGLILSHNNGGRGRIVDYHTYSNGVKVSCYGNGAKVSCYGNSGKVSCIYRVQQVVDLSTRLLQNLWSVILHCNYALIDWFA